MAGGNANVNQLDNVGFIAGGFGDTALGELARILARLRLGLARRRADRAAPQPAAQRRARVGAVSNDREYVEHQHTGAHGANDAGERQR